MARTTHIRINKYQKTDIENIKKKHNCVNNIEVLDILLKSYKRFSDLENKVKYIHSISNI